ncbi:MAG TPA: chemotaxis protein CheX [Bdellovibrionales bacterium]|nr:chemotaxis protein CheX [Bdellovibrionales bacterium]
MNTGFDVSSQVLEEVNYIILPASLSDSAVAAFPDKCKQWQGLDVEMHVLDFKNALAVPDAFYAAVQNFSDKLKPKNVNLVSVNMPEAISKEIKRLGLEQIFNRIQTPADLQQKKQFNENDLRRLLFRYLAQAAYAAVEVALNSTVSCDENYSARPDEVPLEQFDMITVISVNNDFLQAEFRLCSSAAVLEKLARAMLGSQTAIDQDLMESMALELLNIIYGHAKSNLNDKESFRLPAAIPRLLKKGEFHRVKRSAPAQLNIMPMVTPMGSFFVEVDFGKGKA